MKTKKLSDKRRRAAEAKKDAAYDARSCAALMIKVLAAGLRREVTIDYAEAMRKECVRFASSTGTIAECRRLLYGD